mmetsp:Transcript_12042/g.17978  ORF Transcript_12042/g.17978 Transcript_12042/m.17978 type:complete len:229 (+) Transcript_12042:149-835(+)
MAILSSPMLLRAPPSTPIRTVSDMSSSSSVDDDLAKATNESLSMGTSIVKDMDNISFVLPPRHKLHLGLYINTAAASPETKSITSVTNTLNCHLASMQLGGENAVNGGVPGFPDFPDCWAGGQPSTPKASNRNSTRQTNKFSNSKGKQKRCHRRIRRTAVNIPFGSASTSSSSFARAAVSLSPGRDMKKCARDERKLRRIAKVVQIKERRRRKKDMGDICRGMAAIKW